MKTSELKDVALDWAVAKCEYPSLVWGETIGLHNSSHQIVIPEMTVPDCYYHPSTEWAQGGPIIEREKISLEWTGENWMAYIKHDEEYFGPTPLIAAMRCYVASKLGDEIEVPEELK